MKKTDSDSHTQGSSALDQFQCSLSCSMVLKYLALLAIIVIGGLVSYFGVAYVSDYIFDRFASIEDLSSDPSPWDSIRKADTSFADNDVTSEILAETDTPSHILAIIACVVIMASIFVTGSLWIRRQHRKPRSGLPKGEIAAEQLRPGAQQRLAEKRQQIHRLFQGKVESTPGFEPLVRHLMSKNLTTILPQKSIRQVTEIMETHHIRHLLVCEKDGRLCGIISDRDLKKKTEGTAKEIMTPEPITVSTEMSVPTAITIMLNHRISCLPVVEDSEFKKGKLEEGKVVGLLTTTDLTLSLQCSLQILAKLTRDAHSLLFEEQENTSTEEELVRH